MPKENDITRIAKRLHTLGAVTTYQSDGCPCEFAPETDGEIVFENNERDEWESEFEFEGKTFDDVTRILITEFGPPSKVHPLHMGHGPINNWDVGRALIVHGGSDVSVSQRFTRR